MKQLSIKNRKWIMLGLAMCATVIGIVAKLALTNGPLLPGIDGAYNGSR